MVLAAILMLAVLMAVPAMAADNAHTNHDGWTELKSGTTTLTAGKYYLKGEITASITSTSGEIVICLNGQTWNGNGKRPLAVTGGSVTICDCCYTAPSVNEETGAVGQLTGGRINGHDYSGASGKGDGGTISISSGATLTLESGIITGGRASSGGNINNAGTVILSGGVVCDGEAGAYNASTLAYSNKGWGGNINNTGTLTVSGAIVFGGKAGGNGGNIRNTSPSTFNMTAGTVSGGDSRDNGGNLMIQGNATLSGGLIIAGTANNGGNISANAGSKDIVLSGVTIKNGVNCGGKNANSQFDANNTLKLNANLGANVRLFNASPKTLTIGDGTVITGGQSTAQNGSQNLYVDVASGVTTTTAITIGNATIDGNVYIANGSPVTLTGAPQINGGTINLSIGGGTLTASGMTGGSVGITATGDARAISAAGASAYAGYLFADSASELDVAYNSSDTQIWLCAKYCVCGASKNGSDHKLGCDEENYTWLPWLKTNALPTSGNWYLAGEKVQFSGQYVPTQGGTMRLDLNGKTVTDTSSRMIATATTGSGGVTLWITDTSAGDPGTLLTKSPEYTGQGVVLRIVSNSKLYLMAGTIDATLANTTHKSGGGAIIIEGGCEFNMYGGTILGGTAKMGGAVSLSSGTSVFNMYDGAIFPGTSLEDENRSGCVYVAGTLNLHGGSIAGFVDASAAKAVNVYGGQISGGTTNLHLGEKQLTVSDALAEETNVIVSCTDGAAGSVIASNVTSYNGGIFYQGGQYQVAHNATDKTLVLRAVGAVVKGDDARGYDNLSQALAAAKSGEYVCLTADYTGNVSFTGDLYLDLNGYDITGNVTVDGKLYLLDSATADYTVEDDEGYGTVTGTVTGAVRAFTTAAIRQNYDDHNYRYVTVCVDGKYSSHRIYMTVKSTVLQPQLPGLNYRTVLRCNEYFAQLVNEQGGYGIVLNAKNSAGAATYTHGNYVTWGKTVKAYAQEGDVITQENNMVTLLDNMLDTADKNSAANQYNASAKVTARAYVWIDDDLVDPLQDETAGDAAAQKAARSANAQAILTNGVLTSAASSSLKDVIQLADASSKWDTLTLGQKKALGGMYGRWEALMESWGLVNIPTQKDVNVQYGCLCGDPHSTGNPCAENGHVEFAWDIWEEADSLPTVSGNYYLNTDVTLDAQASIGEDLHINLNTCGHSITAPADRVALVYGIFNLTNYGYNGATVNASSISGHGHNTADIGGVLLIESGANVSLYSGVTLKPAATYDIKEGVAFVSGTLNIYGGNIIGADVTANSGNGGAVSVGESATMYMNAGTISGGTAICGGNIFTKGTVTIAGGTISGGTAVRDAADKNGSQGGNIYIADGTTTLSGGKIENGQGGKVVDGVLVYSIKDASDKTVQKGWGGNIYSNGGTLTISGTGISGGRTGGNGGSVNINAGSFAMTGGSMTGGQTNDQGGNLFINVGATLTGGSLTDGKAGNGGNLALGNNSNGVAVTLQNVTITGGTATSAGGNIRVQNNSKTTATSLTIESGTVIKEGQAAKGGNIEANCALNIAGGQIYDGTATNADSNNILVANWPLTLSGGTVSGGVHLLGNQTDTRVASLTLTGKPVVTGSGILLQDTTGKNPITVTLDTAKLDKESASVVLRTSTFVDDRADGIRLGDSSGNEWLARSVLQDMAGFGGSEVTYEKDGIYLKKSTDSSMKWSCKCGANYGQAHVNGCDGYDVRYDAWTSKTLPNQPGNWYLSYTTTKNAAGVEYVNAIKTATFGLDYCLYNGVYKSVYTLRASGTGKLATSVNNTYMKNDSGKYVSVAEYVEKFPNGPDYAAAVGSTKHSTASSTAYVVDGTAYTVGSMPYTVEKDYTVRIDLNGYKLETARGYRAISFRGIADPDGADGTVYSSDAACRTADVTLDLIDSSQGHTGAIAGYGVYTGVTADGKKTLYSNSGTHWQSHMIWMECTYNPNDKLNACYITLDASSVITGVGPALMVDGGSASFYGSTVIGGVSQTNYIGGTGATSGHLATDNTYGGGAIAVLGDGTLTLNNTTVRDGKSIYSVALHHSKGVPVDQAVGGGNIYVHGGTLNLIDATITGGMALINTGSETNRLPSFSYGSGGGVYVVTGEVNISGNTKIYGNYTGTISGTNLTLKDATNGTNEQGNNFYNCLDPYASGTTITKGKASNLFMSGNTLELSNFTGEVHYSMAGAGTEYTQKSADGLRTNSSYDLSNGGYRGTFATYTGTAPTAKNLICDNTGAPAFIASSGKVYYPATSQDAAGETLSGTSVYKVGYAKVNIHPSDSDLAAGFKMTNYGNDRWTNELYAAGGAYNGAYYDITNDKNLSNFMNDTVWNTELYATVLATTDGEGDTVIIIALDAQTHSDDVATKVKRMVSLATGVPQNNISVSSDHIHCAPAPSVSYVQNDAGKNVLDANGRATIKTDYATTFYTGIVDAAVQALKNQKQVESISVGTLDTTQNGQRYNFTRNLELWSGGVQIGMRTDNYATHFYSSKLLGTKTGYVMPGGSGSQITDYLNSSLHIYSNNAELKYESEADADLQLVQYVTVDGKKIIMTNFQTHPHLGSGSDSYYVHSDVVGAFRAWLESYTGAQVLYFSGGGGNVNTTTNIAGDRTQYPYANNDYTKTDIAQYIQGGSSATNTPLTRVCKANDWGKSLATMANTFLKGSGNMEVVLSSEVSGSRDVAVSVTEYSGKIRVVDASDKAVAKAANIYNWTEGEYKNGFVSFGEYETWSKYVTSAYPTNDNVYSSFNANRIRLGKLRAEAGQTVYEMNLTAYAMGEIGFIAAPYEMFHENGKQIKVGSAGEGKDYAMTIVATLANGSNGYIPSIEGYNNGGYSTDQTHFAPGTGEDLANRYIAMLDGLK